MQMPNLLKKSRKRITKSQALLLGSLLIFGGVIFLSWNYLLHMRDEVFSDMKLAMMDTPSPTEGENGVPTDPAQGGGEEYHGGDYVVDYSKYYGVIEIPKIGLKRGFYNVGSPYNDIKYNVTMMSGSIPPTEGNGNLVLLAHSGDSYISYFAYLYRLGGGDDCYITIGGVTYHYKIVKIYEVMKTGLMIVNWHPEHMTLTLVTCTKDNDNTQTVYVADFID